MSIEMPFIEFDYGRYRRLKQRYKQAVKKGEREFEFNGSIFLTEYAKYVLEYLSNEFNDEGK